MKTYNLINDFEESKKALLDRLNALEDRWEVMFNYMIEQNIVSVWTFYEMCDKFGINMEEAERYRKIVFDEK